MRATSLFLLLCACGRAVDDAPVRMVGVGMDPDEIAPEPEPYGGVVGYDRVELAGGGLALAHAGLGSFEEVYPATAVSFAPPYSMIVGFSYLFDQKLTAAANLSFTAPVAPRVPDSCYTVIEPEGPIGSFTTVDVGDYMEFVSEDGQRGFRLSRVPGDIPPTGKDLFVYYSAIEQWAPTARTYLEPDPSDPANPAAMVPVVYRKPNWPAGEELIYRFPGGYSRFDQPIASIPRPSASVATGNPRIRVPGDAGPVLMSWEGPGYDANGTAVTDGPQSRCLEFWGESRPAATIEDCAIPVEYPTASEEYESFRGQIYTGPWDAPTGVRFQWAAGTGADEVALSLRFMAPVDPTDPAFQTPQVDGRAATACEEATAEPAPNPSMFGADGEPGPAMKGDPFSKMIEVSCLLADDGDFTLEPSHLDSAMRHLGSTEAGGVVFFFSRGTRVEGEVPDVKDQYDQVHVITPIAIGARDVKIGRFQWNGMVPFEADAKAGGAE